MLNDTMSLARQTAYSTWKKYKIDDFSWPENFPSYQSSECQPGNTTHQQKKSTNLPTGFELVIISHDRYVDRLHLQNSLRNDPEDIKKTFKTSRARHDIRLADNSLCVPTSAHQNTSSLSTLCHLLFLLLIFGL